MMSLANMQTFSAGISMHELQTIMLFGIGALFIYIVVPVALMANEVRQANQSDDTSGTASILNAMVQSYFFIIAWLLFATILTFFLVAVGGKGSSINPAVGIFYYWNIDWIFMGNSFIEKLPFSDAQLKEAETIVFILSSAKLLEYLLLSVLLMLTLKLSLSLPLTKMRRTDHYKMSANIDVGTLMSFFMVGIMGWLMFKVIIIFDETLLNAILDYGVDKKGLSMITKNANNHYVDVLNNVWELIRQGITKIKEIK